jgi:hypothetical protein
MQAKRHDEDGGILTDDVVLNGLVVTDGEETLEAPYDFRAGKTLPGKKIPGVGSQVSGRAWRDLPET